MIKINSQCCNGFYIMLSCTIFCCFVAFEQLSVCSSIGHTDSFSYYNNVGGGWVIDRLNMCLFIKRVTLQLSYISKGISVRVMWWSSRQASYRVSTLQLLASPQYSEECSIEVVICFSEGSVREPELQQMWVIAIRISQPKFLISTWINYICYLHCVNCYHNMIIFDIHCIHRLFTRRVYNIVVWLHYKGYKCSCHMVVQQTSWLQGVCTVATCFTTVQ